VCVCCVIKEYAAEGPSGSNEALHLTGVLLVGKVRVIFPPAWLAWAG